MTRLFAWAGALSMAASAAVLAQPVAPPQVLSALALLQPGQWSLHAHDRPSDNRSICVGDPRALLQVRHGEAMCSRFVIASDARTATVHYTCPGSGHGRTTIRVESPHIIQIETQGIAGGQPFILSWEGRRTGNCAAKQSSAIR